jgi:hypothetical protein
VIRFLAAKSTEAAAQDQCEDRPTERLATFVAEQAIPANVANENHGVVNPLANLASDAKPAKVAKKRIRTEYMREYMRKRRAKK